MKTFYSTLFLLALYFSCSAVNITDNMVYYARMNERTGTNVNDTVGNNDGTQSNCTINQAGKLDRSFLFNGTTSVVVNPDNAAMQMGTSDFTMVAWVKPTSFSVSWKGIIGGENNAFVFGTYGNLGNLAIAKNGVYGQYTSLYLDVNQWQMVTIVFRSNIDAGNVTVYKNTESSVHTLDYDFDAGAASNIIGGITQFANLWNGNIDEVGIWKRALSAYEISTIYNSGSGITYPFTTWNYKGVFTYGNSGTTPIKKYSGGNQYGFHGTYPTPPPLPQSDSIEYIFANNFESFSTGSLSYDTIMKHFQVWKTAYSAANNFILNVGAPHNKVWHAVVLTGQYDPQNGFEIFIPLANVYDELWLDFDIRTDPNFTTIGQGGASYHSCKFPGGLYGGLNFNTANKDSAAYSNLSSSFWFHNVGGTSTAMGYTYNLSAYQETGAAITNIPMTDWEHRSVRLKVNVPGIINGIGEFYKNYVFVTGMYQLKMRSVAQTSAYGKIEGVKLSFFFGGGTASYASTRNQWIEFDNIVVTKANSGTRKITGASPTGHAISAVSHADLNVPPILYNEDFTAATDTIQSHYVVETPPNSKNTYVKTIVRPSGNITLNFVYYRLDFDYGDNSWMKIYTGVGAGRSASPIFTFSRIALPNSTYVITASSITIEYYMGTNYGFTKGWKIIYTN